MHAPKFLPALLSATLLAASAQAAPIPPYADASATLTPWENYGDLVAQQWDWLDVAPSDSKPAAPQPVANADVRPVSAKTSLVNMVDAAVRISEPASKLLMLVGLGCLAIMVRRKMPE